MTPDNSLAWLRLLRAQAPGRGVRQLLAEHGSAEAALAAGAQAWRRAGLSDEVCRALDRPDTDISAALDADRRWLDQAGRHLIGLDSPDYPLLLARAPSPPLALFVDGNPDALWYPQIAVVGSRSPTAGGRENTRAFTRAFVKSGLAVTSGLASGVDTEAHHSALEAGGLTVAVIGTGPDRCYPPANRELAARIAAGGCVVSEFLPGTEARREHFPRRNRVIAGLSLGVLVIEAAERSGALITARLAGDAGRDVFAVPGSIHNPLARGCHRLIRQGAALVESASEVAEALAPIARELADGLRVRLAQSEAPDARRPGPDNGSAFPLMEDPDYRRLWDALAHDPVPLDTLAERTGLTADALSSMLMVMELEGLLSVEHGRFARRG